MKAGNGKMEIKKTTNAAFWASEACRTCRASLDPDIRERKNGKKHTIK
jgi:hypothetical protein